jgi:phospholipid/cholesterol/gamma-HCH transport system substrate-binding protein
MSPTSPRHAVKVGLFVSGAVAILAAGVFTIGDLNETFTTKVKVSAVFDEVGGLQGGDNVWFSGVKVGRVTRLALRDGSKVQVEMKIDADATHYIHQGTLAKIGSDGLIGNQIVVLYGSPPDAAPLVAGDVLHTEASRSTEDMMVMLQETNTNVLAITSDIKQLSAGLVAGEGSAGKLLRDDALYSELAGSAADLGVAMADARAATADVSAFASKLDQPGTLPYDLVNDRTTHAAMTDTMVQARQAGARASDLMDGLATGAADPDTALGALVADRGAGPDVSLTLQSLARGSEALAADAEAVQYNWLMRRYLRRRAADQERDAGVED